METHPILRIHQLTKRLGLAISQTLITAMNGTIDTQLAEDVITFSVAIPLIEKSKR